MAATLAAFFNFNIWKSTIPQNRKQKYPMVGFRIPPQYNDTQSESEFLIDSGLSRSELLVGQN